MIKKLFTTAILVIVSFFVLGIFANEKKDYSEVENRYLAELKLDKLDKYVEDHLPYRNELISLKNRIEVFFDKKLINGVYVADDGYLISEYVGSTKKDAVIDIINEFAKGKTVDVMLVPDSIEINSDKIDWCIKNNEAEDIEYFYSKLNTNNIELIDEFKKENNSYSNFYYRTDHHWTSYGAFLAYKLYCKDIGIEADESYVLRTVTEEFMGTSSSLAIGLAEEERIIEFKYNNSLKVEYVKEGKKTNTLYDEDALETKDKYSYFLGGNTGLIKITNKGVEEGKLVIIKNSFANCFIPFIVNNYHEVYVVDPRYYSDSVTDLMNENEIDRTLILFNLNNMYSDLSIVKLK